MKTKTFEHKRKVKIWITFILTIITWIGFIWWIDSLELAIVDGWVEWIDKLHFLVTFPIIMVYFAIIIIIVHFYWKLIEWMVSKLIGKFY
jgi:hypothetical protein